MYPAKKHVIRTFETLRGLLPESEQRKPQVILLAGESVAYRHDTDRELIFRQESNFFYLTGCNVPSSFLIASYIPEHAIEGDLGSPSATSVTTTLFIPKANQSDLMWSVPPPSREEASHTHDVTTVEYLPPSLNEEVKKLVKDLAGSNGVVVHTLPRDSTLFPKMSQEHTKQLLNADGTVTLSDGYLLDALQRTRLLKNADEIGMIRQANQISSRAHEVVMRVLGMAVKRKLQSKENNGRPLLPGEWLIEKEAEAEAIFIASCRREGSIHQAYLPIVASSTRASTLHYCCNDKEFAWGPVKPNDHRNGNTLSHTNGTGPSVSKHFYPQVLLIDAGCEWNNYASDITRTMPVGNGGKFTSEARAVYEIVLEMQKEAFSIIKPGVHWDTVQLSCHRTLVKGFQRLGIFKSPESPQSGSWNSAEAILASGDSSAFFPHGVGHSLGLDVHDVPGASKPQVNNTIGKEEGEKGHESFYTYLRLRLPLEAGMVVTVEPGIYFSPHLLAHIRNSKHIDHEVLKRYESVGGVRIEDVVVITDRGYDNLTTVRSDVDWIEGVCSGEL